MAAAPADALVASMKARHPDVFAAAASRSGRILALVAVLVGYVAFVTWYFAVPAVVYNAHWERANLYLAQFVSYEVRPEIRFRDDRLDLRWPRFSPLGDDPHPDWVETGPDGALTVVIGADDRIAFTPTGFTVVRGGEATAFRRTEAGVAPVDGLPDWAELEDGSLTFDWGFWGRADVDGDRARVTRRFPGWPNFLFDTRSKFFGLGPGAVLERIVSGERLDPERSNLDLAFHDVWSNGEWQHGDVWTKLFETIVMAFGGTMLAAVVALPLSFLAARTITPIPAVTFGFKRAFDFLRSVDMLIFALFFTRAFGPGPLAGVSAIFFTDTGTLGKVYAEALETIDGRQVEGVRSVGAGPFFVQRYGVLPQILPVFTSQALYFWESNIRSATIIGAVGAGGIGLKLWEAMQTNTNWANVLYMVLLILGVVYVFDSLSGLIRRRLTE